MNARDLSKYLENFRFRCTGEKELQEAIGQALLTGGFEFIPEFRINPKDRIDFMVVGRLDHKSMRESAELRGNALLSVGGHQGEKFKIGIEVKVDGSVANVMSQISRYLESDKVDSVLLVTTRNKHLDMPTLLRGKLVAVHFTAIGSAF